MNEPRCAHRDLAGDALLRLVAARLPGSVPEDSLVARVGGDEFTILLKGSLSQREAEDIAANVYGRVSDPYALDGETVHISTSIGIAFAKEGTTPDAMLRQADCALYAAKGAGKAAPRPLFEPPQFALMLPKSPEKRKYCPQSTKTKEKSRKKPYLMSKVSKQQLRQSPN
mgnify:CR=1 FL=1